MPQSLKICLTATILTFLTGCGAQHSPDIYASNAVQQANKVDAGVIIGFREVMISANGTAGAVTGGAAGGVLGSQVGGSSFDAALGGVAGSTLGSVIGNTIEHVTLDTKGWEYIVRKHNGDLISVTQAEPKPLALGQKVLVIAGAQARIVADYSVEIPTDRPAASHREESPREKSATEEPIPVSAPVMPARERPSVSDLPPVSPQHSYGSATELPQAIPVVPTAAPE